jgi:biopolymer transport protein ExbD
MKITRMKKTGSLIPLASMADIAFLLLIFFMISSIIDIEREIPVRLPGSETIQIEKGRSFTVWITASGDYYFDGRRDTAHNLVSYARYRLAGDPGVKALVSADRDLPFESVNGVLESLREAGVYNIVMVAKKSRGTGPHE